MKNKSSRDKYFYELSGQVSMFGRDNLAFKSINMPKKQHFDNICKNFKLKKLTKRVSLFLEIICIKKT
mgnify:CR=1 FL=1